MTAAAKPRAMSSQATWACESHMDIIARRMGRDPAEFRLTNLLRDGDGFATGRTMPDVRLATCLRACACRSARRGRRRRDRPPRGIGYTRPAPPRLPSPAA